MLWLCVWFIKLCFLAQDVIYTSRAYATMSVSVCLSVCLWQKCIVVTGCNGSRIPFYAWIDGCLCYLLTMPDPHCRIGWCQDFWWKRGYGKIGNCARSSCFCFVNLSLLVLKSQIFSCFINNFVVMFLSCWIHMIWCCHPVIDTGMFCSVRGSDSLRLAWLASSDWLESSPISVAR